MSESTTNIIKKAVENARHRVLWCLRHLEAHEFPEEGVGEAAAPWFVLGKHVLGGWGDTDTREFKEKFPYDGWFCFERAARCGHVFACYELVRRNLQGSKIEGVERNLEKAIEWLEYGFEKGRENDSNVFYNHEMEMEQTLGLLEGLRNVLIQKVAETNPELLQFKREL